MKVRNDSKALKDYLAREYEREIARVKEHAKQTREETLREYEQQAQSKADELLKQAKRAAKQEQTATIAAAKQEMRRAEQEALGKLLREVTQHVLRRERNKPLQQREQLLADMQAGIKQALAKQGFDPQEFTYEQDPQTLEVRASTQDVLVEDSAQARVQEHKETIIKQIMEQAQ